MDNTLDSPFQFNDVPGAVWASMRVFSALSRQIDTTRRECKSHFHLCLPYDASTTQDFLSWVEYKEKVWNLFDNWTLCLMAAADKYYWANITRPIIQVKFFISALLDQMNTSSEHFIINNIVIIWDRMKFTLRSTCCVYPRWWSWGGVTPSKICETSSSLGLI